MKTIKLIFSYPLQPSGRIGSTLARFGYLLLIIIYSCTNDPIKYQIKGEIIAIGNMPFVELAIRDNNNNYYALNISDKKIEKELYELQGNIVIIKYNYTYLYLGIIHLNVIGYNRS